MNTKFARPGMSDLQHQTPANREVLEPLARFMYEALEHLDPSDDRPWLELTERERDLYRHVVRALEVRRSTIIAALDGALADDDFVNGRPK
jgi:hypothetical protein